LHIDAALSQSYEREIAVAIDKRLLGNKRLLVVSSYLGTRLRLPPLRRFTSFQGLRAQVECEFHFGFFGVGEFGFSGGFAGACDGEAFRVAVAPPLSVNFTGSRCAAGTDLGASA
jgi:hypothetical protein